MFSSKQELSPKETEVNSMEYRLLAVSLTVLLLFPGLSQKTIAQDNRRGQTNWVDGTITAVGEGTATPSGNKMKDQLRAVRAATILAQRGLLEIVTDLRIDSETKVKNRMIQEDAVKTRIEGTIQGAEIFRQNIRWEGNTPIATVELGICLGGFGACKSDRSIVDALALDQKSVQTNAPTGELTDIVGKQDIVQKPQNILYDLSKPVTGIIFNLQGLPFERVILPVVLTIGEGDKPITVYSVRMVEPQIIRTYGIVRYADSTGQAKQNPHLGDNVIVVPVSGITKGNMITIGFDAARLIRETISHGNDYLRNGKVMIAAR